jgi:hypothetical protein
MVETERFTNAHQWLAAPLLCVCTPKYLGEYTEYACIWRGALPPVVLAESICSKLDEEDGNNNSTVDLPSELDLTIYSDLATLQATICSHFMPLASAMLLELERHEPLGLRTLATHHSALHHAEKHSTIQKHQQ